MQNQLGEELLLVCEILEQTCCFVNIWQEVANHAMRVFAIRKAECKATAERIDEVKKTAHYCWKWMCVSSTDNWIAASTIAVKFLNKYCLEAETLFLCPGAILRPTSNKQTYHGQLCV